MRSLLVHVDGSARCGVRLMLASQLARRHDARLTALYATTPPLLDPSFAYAASAVVLDTREHAHAHWHARARAEFDSARAAQPDQTSWAELDTGEPPVSGFVKQAFYADLLVLGQADPTGSLDPQVPPDFVESVLIGSGRPALIIPYAGPFRALPQRALVAWKPSPQAARALSAALPLLQRMEQVHVVSWGLPAPRASGDTLDVERYLQSHGVTATMHRFVEEPSGVGELLLSMASDVGAELVVMGCYGHSRAREFVLGGASRTVLRSMTVPVLASH